MEIFNRLLKYQMYLLQYENPTIKYGIQNSNYQHIQLKKKKYYLFNSCQIQVSSSLF